MQSPWFFPRCVVSPALAALLSLAPAFNASAEETSSPSQGGARALSQLVREYLETEDSEKAGRTLVDILKYPDASVEAVTVMIQAGWPYGTEPVGMQPGVPVRVRERTYRYGLYVPVSYRPTNEYPMVICLHGAGFTGDAYLERWQSRLGDEYILACPTLVQGAWWTHQGEELVLETIRAVQARYRVDQNRVFLTGMSNGGVGVYLVGAHHAPLFAGLAPMASGIDDVLFPFLENLRQTPVYVIHGLRDQVMPVELSRSIVRELTRLSYQVVYREHDRTHPTAGGHFFPREELPDLIAWFGSRRRDPVPPKVTVVRDATHLGRFGWVRIDATDRIAAFTEQLTDSRDEAIVNRIYARLEAEVVAPNRIEVRTERVRRYSLFLNRALVDPSKPVTIVTNGRTAYEGPVTPSLGTLLREARFRRDRQTLFPILVTLSVEGGS